MEKTSKNATGAVPAAMTPRASRSKNQETSKFTENFNPNLLSQSQQQSPGSKTLIPNPKSSSSSPVVSKSCSVKKSQKPKNPNSNSPKNKIRQRKFVVAKKKQKKDGNEGHDADSSCNCKDKKEGDAAVKCPCLAYQNLRKSQEEFFKDRHHDEEEGEEEAVELETVLEQQQEQQHEKQGMIVKRNRQRLMEEGRESVTITQIGSGKVMSLIKAFENLLSEPPISNDQDHKEDDDKVMKWPPSNLTLTSQNLGLDPGASVSSSWDSTRGSSVSTRTSNGGRRSRRNSLESSTTTIGGGRRWRKKQQKVTSLRPFKLRTEQRGKLKEEEFVKKIQEIMTEEEKQRIPIAQGLPWTTDEPECLVKPPVKEITIPVDLKLHTDVRALDRAEFDQQMAEKLSFIEQYKLERERERKLAEEEEIKRLRKELVPKAQPMPYFDRPFIPRRSMKSPTLPRTPKLHKKIKCSTQPGNDMNPYSSSCLN